MNNKEAHMYRLNKNCFGSYIVSMISSYTSKCIIKKLTGLMFIVNNMVLLYLTTVPNSNTDNLFGSRVFLWICKLRGYATGVMDFSHCRNVMFYVLFQWTTISRPKRTVRAHKWLFTTMNSNVFLEVARVRTLVITMWALVGSFPSVCANMSL